MKTVPYGRSFAFSFGLAAIAALILATTCDQSPALAAFMPSS